jgi:hypothetical protein
MSQILNPSVGKEFSNNEPFNHEKLLEKEFFNQHVEIIGTMNDPGP